MSETPTARELLAEDATYRHHPQGDMLAARVEKVLALHKPYWKDDRQFCEECDAVAEEHCVYWPCSTVCILNGKE